MKHHYLIYVLGIATAALFCAPQAVYAAKKPAKQIRYEAIRITKMKYDCYLDTSFTEERKEYATTGKQADRIKDHVSSCVTTGDDVTDPKYVIRYRLLASSDDELKKAFLKKSDWMDIAPGCYTARVKGSTLTDFRARSCND